LAAARRAEDALAVSEVSPAARQRVRQMLAVIDGEKRQAAVAVRDRQMLAELEEIRLRATGVGPDGLFDSGTLAEGYGRAFRAYSIDVSDPEQAAVQIRTSPLRAALLACLDHWASRLEDATAVRRIIKVAQAAEPDPRGWSARVRDALMKGDRKA